jgi:hypothetical protein
MAQPATVPSPPTGIAALIAEAKAAFVAARRRRAERAELGNLAPGDRDRILRDLGEPPGDLTFIDRAQPCAGALLAGMMARLGVDSAHGDDPALVMRDLERTCAECPEWRRCRYWQAGEIKDDPRDFCLNMPTFDALRHEKVRTS